jgi:hypothetical protein
MADLRKYAKKASEELHIPLNGCLNVNDLIRIYYSLHILMGGDAELMRHWLNVHNTHLGFNPASKLCDEKSVQKIIGYLENFIDR